MSSQKIIVFDGVCVLCSRWVQFVLKRDQQCEFYFAAMQTVAGRELLTSHGIDPDDPATFLLLDGGVSYIDTDAACRVISHFGFGWRLLALLVKALPCAISDRIYRWIARHRYTLFGRRDVCWIPLPAHSHRFIH